MEEILYIGVMLERGLVKCGEIVFNGVAFPDQFEFLSSFLRLLCVEHNHDNHLVVSRTGDCSRRALFEFRWFDLFGYTVCEG